MALLELVEEFQREYDIQFDILSYDSEILVFQQNKTDSPFLASIERR